MASIYDLKPAFQGRLRPLAARLARGGVSPNAVTLAALAGSFAVGAALFLRPGGRLVLLLLPAWLFARMALNAIDGMIAREHGRATRAGAVLNEAGDMLSDLALYLPLARVAPGPAWPAVLFSAGAVLTEIAGLLALRAGGARRYDGPLGKSDRAFVVGATALAHAAWPAAAAAWPFVLGAGALLEGVTSVNRLRRGPGP